MHTSAWVALRRFHCNPLICCGNELHMQGGPFRLQHCVAHVSSVLDGAALRIDDRLRVAKERREEADKQQGKSKSSVGFRIIWLFNPSGTN